MLGHIVFNALFNSLECTLIVIRDNQLIPLKAQLVVKGHFTSCPLSCAVMCISGLMTWDFLLPALFVCFLLPFQAALSELNLYHEP